MMQQNIHRMLVWYNMYINRNRN